jgi:DNA polymerase/3'-5' exonuclease PolX
VRFTFKYMYTDVKVTLENIETFRGMPCIGNSLLNKMIEILKTGKLKKLEEFKKDPKFSSLIEIGEIWGVGPKTAQDLLSKGFKSVEDIRKSGMHLMSKNQKIGTFILVELFVHICGHI